MNKKRKKKMYNNNQEELAFYYDMQSKEEQLFIQQVLPTQNIISYRFTPLSGVADVLILSANNQSFMAEVKHRQDYKVATLAKYGPYLEKKKFDGMVAKKAELAHKKEYQLLYISICHDGVLMHLLNLDPHFYQWEWKLLPKNEWEPNVKINKLVATLHNPCFFFKKN